MFEAALDQVGVLARECAHVGDHLVDDIEGATAVGMHTVWVNFADAPLTTADPAPSETVRELPQVVAAIERIDAAG